MVLMVYNAGARGEKEKIVPNAQCMPNEGLCVCRIIEMWQLNAKMVRC